jgi:hypothetical protein
MNKKILIVSLVVFLGLSVATYQYTKEFQSEFTSAAYSTSKPANGHSWSEMECTAGLCVTSDNKVGIGTDAPAQKLSVNGIIESTSGGIKFPDGTVQTTKTLVGATGPAGPQGPVGATGPAGPAGTSPTSASCTYQSCYSNPSTGTTTFTCPTGTYVIMAWQNLCSFAGCYASTVDFTIIGSTTYTCTSYAHGQPGDGEYGICCP